MAFRIQRSQKSLPGVSSTVRANIDVDTGGQMIARAVQGLGIGIANLGLKYRLMEADSQLTKAKRLTSQEYNRYVLSLKGNLDPSTYPKAYEGFKTNSKAYVPQDPIAARAYDKWFQGQEPVWENDTVGYQEARVKDNVRTEGFNSQQLYIEEGGTENYTTYLVHLQKGVMLDAYSSEEATKYLQFAIDNRKKYVQSEQAGIERERKEALVEAKEQAASKFLVGIWNGDIKDPQNITDALDAGILTDTDAKYLRKTILSSEPAVHNNSIYSEALSMLNEYKKRPTKKGKAELESFIIKNQMNLNEAKGMTLIEDMAKIETPNDPLSTPRAKIYFGLLQSLYEDKKLDPLTYDQKHTKLRNFFKKNPDATADVTNKFYDELMDDVKRDMLDRILNPIGFKGGTVGTHIRDWWSSGKKGELPEPKTKKEYYDTVQALDEEDALEYYNKWRHLWQ
jgi:hypothetical protein